MKIRSADPDDLAEIMNVLDGANLAVEAETVEERIDVGEVLVAEEGGPVLGALVAVSHDDWAYVEAIAVRRSRRGKGLGTTLVQKATDRFGPLIADFDADLRLFYQSLGFTIESLGEGRFRGRLGGPSPES
jgi:GNAT superfamily N-acetyltransferase